MRGTNKYIVRCALGSASDCGYLRTWRGLSDTAHNDLTYVLPHLVDFIEVLAVPGSGGLLLATAAAASAGPWTAGLRFLTGTKVRREEKRRRD